MKPITLWQMRETSADLEFRGALLQKMKEKELTAYERELHSFLDKLSMISGEANPDQAITIKKIQASSDLLNGLLKLEQRDTKNSAKNNVIATVNTLTNTTTNTITNHTSHREF